MEIDHKSANARIQRALRRGAAWREKSASFSSAAMEVIMANAEMLVRDWKSKTGLMPSETVIEIRQHKDEFGRLLGYRLHFVRADNA